MMPSVDERRRDEQAARAAPVTQFDLFGLDIDLDTKD